MIWLLESLVDKLYLFSDIHHTILQCYQGHTLAHKTLQPVYVIDTKLLVAMVSAGFPDWGLSQPLHLLM